MSREPKPARFVRPTSNRGRFVAGGPFGRIVNGWCCCALALSTASAVSPDLPAADDHAQRGSLFSPAALNFEGPQGSAAREYRQQAIERLPMTRLTAEAQQRILSIAKSPTIYRRLPTQAIDCDREMFLFLARHPEVMVGMWELMGITQVTTRRIGPYELDANDGNGTTCNIDLIYGDPHLHIYVTEGGYEGVMTPRPLTGKGLAILTSRYASGADGGTTVTGTIDLFIQVDNLGLDLIARTLSPVIGRSADYNFLETSRFASQISQAAQRNPPAMIHMASRIPQVSDQTRDRFIGIISAIGTRAALSLQPAVAADAYAVSQADY